MNTDRTTTLPAQGPDCAAFAPLLPRGGQRLVGERANLRLREHLAGCAYCQAVLAVYERMDAALVRHVDRQVECVAGLQGLTEDIMEPITPARVATRTATLPPPDRGRRGSITWLGAVAAVLAIAVVTAALFASRGPHGGPRPTATIPPPPTPTPVSAQLDVSDIAMVSPSDGWAFAHFSTTACAQPTVDPQTHKLTPNPACKTSFLMLHYDGRSWSIASTGGLAMSGGLSMTSASEGWALGIDLTSHHDAVIHYSGGRWFADATYAPPDGKRFENLAMIAPNEGWATGQECHNTCEALLMHYTQGQWVQVPLPGTVDTANAHLQSIAMQSASAGWVVGTASPSTDGAVLILRYQNGTWTKENVDFPGSLNSVYAVSPDEAWAVGEENKAFGPGLILHYKAGTWTKVTGLDLNILHAVTMVSPTEGWAVGDGAMFLHYHNGAWSQVGQPIHSFWLSGVSMASPTDGWAVGSYLGGDPHDDTNLFHYTNGAWTPYSLSGLLAQLSQ
jgi:hypothetical protein